jgi:hypothetical protein
MISSMFMLLIYGLFVDASIPRVMAAKFTTSKPTTTGRKSPLWSDLKTTFPVFSPVPLNVNDAKRQGWVLNKDCSKGLGNRYVKKNDTLILIFGANGAIVGKNCTLVAYS